MKYKPGSLVQSHFNYGRFLYCSLKEQVDVYGNLKSANFFLRHLKTTFNTKEKRQYLKALLSIDQWKDLERLVGIIKTGKIHGDFVWSKEVDSSKTAKRQLSFRERELALRILENRVPLKDALGLQQLVSLKPEDNYGEFGRADLFAVGDRIGFPIELKDETANERISGQILKYIKGSTRLIKFGSFDRVQGVVIAPCFSKESLDQLRLYKVWSFQIAVDKSGYSLERIP